MPRLSTILLVGSILIALSVACGDQPESDDLPVTATPKAFPPTPVPTQPFVPTSTPEPTSTPLPTETPAPPEALFVPDLCRVQEPPGVIAQCGNLVVPENRSDPNTGVIDLHVMVLGTTSRDPALDPVVYLSGGPGSSIVETVSFQLPLFEEILRERDVIIFDQRGVGTSEPALDCPGYMQFILDSLDDPLTVQEHSDGLVESLRACGDRLQQEGADLTAYNTDENAADVNELRIQLGLQEWNLYGVSYGSRLAMAVMRDYPQGVRSVIIDSAFPIDVDFFASIVPNTDRALKTLFDACSANPPCNTAYPNLEAKFYAIAATLDQTPGQATVSNPFTGQVHDVAITGERFIQTIFDALYVQEFIPLLPEVIYAAEENEFDTFGFIFGVILAQLDFLSPGMYYSAQCADEIPFTSVDRANSAAEAYPQLLPYVDASAVFDICGSWDSGRSNQLKAKRLASDIPTLILAGQFDPITPPDWGRAVHSALSESYFVEIPAAGHAVLGSSECSIGIAQAFLRNPNQQPDASCISNTPPLAFKTPASAGVSLVPFEEPALGIRGLIPAGWFNIAPGIYTESILTSDVLIVQQGIPTDVAPQVLPAFAQQFGITIPEEPNESLELQGVDWSVYQIEVEDLLIDAAVSGDDRGLTYLVILVSNPQDRDTLYRNVFLPSLAAIEIAQPQ